MLWHSNWRHELCSFTVVGAKDNCPLVCGHRGRYRTRSLLTSGWWLCCLLFDTATCPEKFLAPIKQKPRLTSPMVELMFIKYFKTVLEQSTLQKNILPHSAETRLLLFYFCETSAQTIHSFFDPRGKRFNQFKLVAKFFPFTQRLLFLPLLAVVTKSICRIFVEIWLVQKLKFDL